MNATKLSRICMRATAMSSLVMVVTSCVERSESTAAFGGTPMAPIMRGQFENEGVDVQAGSNVGPVQLPEGITPEEDILFTDPDDPNAKLPELSAILTDPDDHKGPWERSVRQARKASIRQGKPLLLWFTDSKRSPRCRQLDQELFSQPDFQQWASTELIRMRVDESEELDDSENNLGEAESMRVRHAAYVQRLKNRYKVLGYPTLILLDPTGRLIGNYRGYRKGEANLIWGRIKQASVASEHAYRIWRDDLERKGYRDWRDLKGRKVFAKLTHYADGTLTLIEPDGTRSRTHEQKLSVEDRVWIAEQKARRGR